MESVHNITDVDLINWIKHEVKKDATFTQLTDVAYKAWLRGQILGARRIIERLKEFGILKSFVKNGVKHYRF